MSTAEIEIFPQVSTWSVASFATLTPCCRASITRPANCSSLTHTHALAVRFATVELPSRTEKRPTAAVARQHFADDRELAHLVEFKSAMAPAQTGVAGWAAELAAIVVQDVADWQARWRNRAALACHTCSSRAPSPACRCPRCCRPACSCARATPFRSAH
jgi:hypothetical protein